MVPGAAGERPEEVLEAVERCLAEPAGVLKIGSGDLLGLIEPAHRESMIEEGLGLKPSRLEPFRIAIGGLTRSAPKQGGVAGAFDIFPSAETVGMIFGHIKHQTDKHKYNSRKTAVRGFLNSFTVTRHAVSLDNRERSLLSGMAALYAARGLSIADWHSFYTLLVWAGGRGRLDVIADTSSAEHASHAEQLLRGMVGIALPGYEQSLASAAAKLSAYQGNQSALARKITDSISHGARWLEPEDIHTSRIYSLQPKSSALLVGHFGDAAAPLYFNGNESLITFGGPGAGKTQCQVIPNLLRYPGSAFVLDVKDELYRDTAHIRSQLYGPVYRFAPTDETGTSNRYNPFDVISSDPQKAAVQCQVLANELIPDNSSARDPYWDRKAREFVWAFSVAVALDAPPEERNVAHVSKYLSIPTQFEDRGARFLRSETKVAIEKLRAIAKVTSLEGLASVASAIENGVTSPRLESVFDAARSQLSSITQTPSAVAAMAKSDWTPAQLRSQPGTTVYLCLKPGELRAFASLVRLLFSQHVKELLGDFTRRPDEPPVTFFLDEMPQLGAMPGLSDIIDVGRGAGVRLWMFAQYLGQLRAIYGEKADGLINACALRCFMQPDLDAARFISPQLGMTRNMFTGETKPLAEAHDLMGRAFGDRILALGRAEHPAQLSKRYAFEEALCAQPMPRSAA